MRLAAFEATEPTGLAGPTLGNLEKHMKEREIRGLIDNVREGKLARRSFIERMVALGLTAPMASMLLMHEGVAQTPAPIPYKPTKRGGGGALKLIYWQAAVHLNPHFAGGTKEQDATPHLLRSARRVGHRRQPDPDAGHRNPVRARTAAFRPTARASPGNSNVA